jgi:uncharacterized protein
MDIFADPKIKSRIILESPVKSSEQFYISVVKPREYEDDERVKSGLATIFDRKIVSHFVKPQSLVPRCSDILAELKALKSESVGKHPHYINAIDDIYQKLLDFMIENSLTEANFIDENFVDILCEVEVNAMKTFRVNDKASLYAWATTRETLKSRLKKRKNQSMGDEGITTDKLREVIEGDTRLTCISISDPYTIKNLVVDLTSDFLYKIKKQFKVKPYILFVFDEAQEFVADLSNARGIEKECSIAVETLLRQGRKYGLGGCIATQRIAYTAHS